MTPPYSFGIRFAPSSCGAGAPHRQKDKRVAENKFSQYSIKAALCSFGIRPTDSFLMNGWRRSQKCNQKNAVTNTFARRFLITLFAQLVVLWGTLD